MTGRYKAYPEYKNSGIEWLKEMPAHWDLVKAKHIFKKVQRAVRPEDSIVTAFRDGEVTLRSNRRTDGFTNAAKEIGYQGVRRGDLLVHAMDGFAGAIGISDSNGKCSPVCSVCIPWYQNLGYLVRQLAVTDYITSLAKGIRERSTEFRFNEFSGLFLAVPSKVEQQKIANFLDYETAKIDTLITKQEKLIELLKEKRQAVISHAVTKGLNPDAPMKDSGVEWLGEVPEHWDITSLRRFINKMEQGKSPECDSSPAPIEQWGVLKTSCVNNAKFDPTANKMLPPHIEPHSKYEVKGGDILMSRASGSINLIGSVAKVQNDVRTKILLSDKVFRLYLTSLMNTDFFVHLMASSYVRTLVENAISGAEGMANNITKSAIMDFTIPVPPVEEQKLVVADLEKQANRFDILVAKAESANTLIKERKAALISAAVTGKIDVRDWKVMTNG
ncbi:restriction endonuclease subunit S [Vibrio pectenicida]|uniref:restriction endonuclease subunit S n=1 Tax=Vibrio pectenicida TaxID=62763 RepID=UPI003B999CFD